MCVSVIIEALVNGGRTAVAMAAVAVDGGARSDGGDDGTYSGAHGKCAGEQQRMRARCRSALL